MTPYILFQEDWLRPEHANTVVHYETRNHSALVFAAKLKHMGIKNHLFFLSLLNPKLRNVDPYDPNLTQEQMELVGLECRANPWYFFREVALVPAKAGTTKKLVEFNRSNICLWWCFFNHVTLYLTQPRQTGKSFCVDLLMTELMGFMCDNTQINLMTKDDKLRAENIQRLKDIYEALPDYLQLKGRDDANNTEELSIKKLGNSYKTHVPQASEKRAYNLGRGMSTPIFQTDEGPFQTNIEIALPAALGAMGAAIQSARANGEPYGILHTTTAGRKDDPDGKYMYSLIQDCAIWTERFFDLKDEEELRKIVCMHSRSSRHKAMPQDDSKFEGNYEIYAVFSYKQLGKTDEWMVEQLTRTKQKGEDANRDFFNIWTAGTSSSPLPPEIAEQIGNSIVDSDCQTIDPHYGYVLRWYLDKDNVESFMKTREVVVGIDTSDAVGRDHIGMVFTDVMTGGVVATTFINRTNLIQYAKWLVKLLIDYPKLTMIIERRSSGVMILDYLLEMLPQHGIDPFKRLFNWVINDPVQYKNQYEEACQAFTRHTPETYVRAKERFGFATAGSGPASRNELYSTILFEAATKCTTRIHDRTLTQQILGLVIKNGRIDHSTGEHDDMVIAWLLSHWFLMKAKNLHYYGIDSAKVLAITTQARRQQNLSSPTDQMREQQQDRLRHRMADLLKQMENEDDEFLTARYEQELRHLESQRIIKQGEDFSLDNALNKMREERGARVRHVREQHYSRTAANSSHERYQIDRNALPSNTRLVA